MARYGYTVKSQYKVYQYTAKIAITLLVHGPQIIITYCICSIYQYKAVPFVAWSFFMDYIYNIILANRQILANHRTALLSNILLYWTVQNYIGWLKAILDDITIME